MGEERLSVSKHDHDFRRGDRQVVHLNTRGLRGGLNKQGSRQSLVTEQRQDQTEQVSEKTAFDSTCRFPARGAGWAVDGAPGADHEPALPEAEQEHNKRQRGQRDTRAQPDGTGGIAHHAASDGSEDKDSENHGPEDQLNPEADPAHPPQSGGQLLEIKSIRHAWPHSSFKLGTKGIHTHLALIPLCSPQDAKRPTALALGSFDGLHAGHRQVIERAIDGDCGVPTVVSFWPHPREVLFGEARLRLDLPSEKVELLEPLGIEQLVLVPFNKELAKLSAEAFIDQILCEALAAQRIAVGANFRFGHNREGDADTLQRLGAARGIAVDVVEIIEDEAGRMSSSRIRSALETGDLDTAKALLGRPFRFQGRVVRGRGLGRELGWPTANLQVDGRKFLPALGVYAAWVELDRTEGRLPAVMNLGPQPTVDPTSPSAVEVHLLDRSLELENRLLTVEPVLRLRGQKKFDGLDALSQQIGRDADQARQCLQASAQTGVG